MRVFNLLKTRIEEMEDNKDVDGLIHALNDDAENVRREAVMALERIGDVRATEPLIQKLQDPDRTIQEESITALGRIQDKKAVPALIQTLNNKHIGIRWRAAEALGKIGDPLATEPLIQKLQDAEQTIQEEAITALGRIQDKKAVPALIQALNNKHIGIRWRAAEALGKIGDPQATEPLIQTLHDPDKTIQEMAITALGRIAVDPFIRDLSSEDQELKEKAIISLNHLRELVTIDITSEKCELPDEKEAISSEQEKAHIEEEELKTLAESDFILKTKNLKKMGFNIYIENLVKNSRYNYLDGFNKKSRYDYEFGDIRKLRELIEYKGIEFTDEEVLLLIQEEIKNQEYMEFKDDMISHHPKNLNQYIETLIKTFPEPQEHIANLKKLLYQENIKHNDLSQEIQRTQKKMEITEFENKILVKEAQSFDETDSPTILKEFRKKELEESKGLMRKNGKYVYIETFVNKSINNYEFGDIRKFKDLLVYKRIKFSDDDLLWLIQGEIKNQQYMAFKDKIQSTKPENLDQYIETLLKTFPEPEDHIENLNKLLKQENIKHTDLAQEIQRTQKKMEIKEFENKILLKDIHEGVLPVDMHELDYAYINFNLGNMYCDLGKTEEALSYYDKALYIYPDFVSSWKNMGLIFFTMGRLQKAAACYNQILLLEPGFPELWVVIGLIFFEIGKVAEAKDCYEKAKELNPCYRSEDLALETSKFLESRPISHAKLDNYLELASSADWESSDPTPPLSRIMTLLNQK
jgi:HEAT repeat protein